ncbi:MAG: rRNA pseudouridine synthase [Alphaproteobacteria bacterium]|nr:rRNA pseudouridine synthase [Alphaproteobacteria bacterium]
MTEEKKSKNYPPKTTPPENLNDKDLNNPDRGERIAKYLARLGIASRRDIEKMIDQKRIVINGDVVTTPASFVTERDQIQVDGDNVGRRQQPRLFMYHKPAGLITTAKDPEGRATVFDSLPQNLPRLISVGRLDLNTEGLLLLTNDGALSRLLELPSSGLKRSYRVRVFAGGGRGKEILAKKLEKLQHGLVWKNVRYGKIEAIVDDQQKQDGHNLWVTMTLTEGKNREIRNVMEALGYQVSRLMRLSYGPFELGGLPRGEVVEIPPKAWRELLPQEIVKTLE